MDKYLLRVFTEFDKGMYLISMEIPSLYSK